MSAGDESLDGAVREVEEELGKYIDKSQLRFLGTIKRKSRFSENFLDHAFDDVYLLHLSFDTEKAKLQTEELTAIKYVPIPTLKQMVDDRDSTLVMRLEEFALLFHALDKEKNVSAQRNHYLVTKGFENE